MKEREGAHLLYKSGVHENMHPIGVQNGVQKWVHLLYVKDREGAHLLYKGGHSAQKGAHLLYK